MDLIKEISVFNVSKIFNSAPISYKAQVASEEDDNKLRSSKIREVEDEAPTEAGRSLIESIWQDDKARFISNVTPTKDSRGPLDRSIASTLLRFCCALDSVECATALINGELGAAVPLVNETDETGRSVLHVAAEMQAARCVELLLRKRARTDLRTKDGRAQLALELSLSSLRLDVTWSPDESSIEDLVLLLSEKDLTALRLLSEKTKEAAEVAYANAIGGCLVSLTALLMVAAEKVNESILELRDCHSGTKDKTTVYECVIREVLALGRGEVTPSIAAKGASAPSKSEVAEKRKLLLLEIELLQLFGAVGLSDSPDKKATPPLIRAAQAGDETIIQMLLKTGTDVNDTDAEGNSALHWSLKTSKSSSPQQMRILGLLLREGARVNQKNMIGSTAVHIAAGNGNSEALQVLLLEDPDTVNYRTEMKETPLFFAVKNDHIDCVELLLHWGASTEVLNLRRQRSIDLATSQDMRFMLNPINISLMNSSVHGDDFVSETRRSLLAKTNDGTPSERLCFNAKSETCKYSKSQSINAQEFKRRIFVGGLPTTLESDSLGQFFEGFGPVEDARVIGVQAGDQIKSRGFGFVTFEHEKSVSAALQAHYVTIMGKQVEIKSVISKSSIASQFQNSSPQQEKCEQNEQHQTRPQLQKLSPQPKISEHCQENDQHQPPTEVPTEKNTEEAKAEPKTWANRLLQGQPKPSSQAQAKSSPVDRAMPAWVCIFKKWFPGFLKKVSSHREEDYALSSLKADFRATFGIELDHVSLGYSKLSDFMRLFPGLCHVKIVPVGRRGPATHTILLPKLPLPHPQPLQIAKPSMPSRATPVDTDVDSSSSKPLEDSISVSSKNSGVTSSSTKEKNMSHEKAVGFSAKIVSNEAAGVNSAQNDSPPVHCHSFLEFLKPDPLFHGRPWLSSGNNDSNDQRGGIDEIKGVRLQSQKRHLVLEALARKWNNSSVFFLREFDFYSRYNSSVKTGLCFGCNQQRMVWSNFPCRHFLWCNDCKKQAIYAAGLFEHKCVVCDHKVQNFLPGSDQFPPLNRFHIMSPSRNSPFPLLGY